MKQFDVIVIGGGPAGLAAAIVAHKAGATVLLIEREKRLGGILKQCIHDGFGLLHFGEKLSGPEYAERFEREFSDLGIACRVQTFVTDIIKTVSKENRTEFQVLTVSGDGVETYRAKALILATGCRERTAKQVSIHGTRPAGIFTAGTAQHFVNLLGQMPTRRCVILGSGDIGLIMARRLTLEGAKVLGVYEVKPEPSGLTRNLVQCLEDYQIPLYLSHTVTRVFGYDRLEAVEVARVDESMKPIPGTEKKIECDALILSVGLIPENEMAQKLDVVLDARTKGPVCDQHFMTRTKGVFSCGNALHVNDLVDYVSESGMLAGAAAARYSREEDEFCCDVEIEADASLQYIVPQRIVFSGKEENVIFYFRSSRTVDRADLVIEEDGQIILEKGYTNLKPPEMKRLTMRSSCFSGKKGSVVSVRLRERTKTQSERKMGGDPV